MTRSFIVMVSLLLCSCATSLSQAPQLPKVQMEGKRLADIESTKLELEEQRIAENKEAYERQRQKLLADKAAKASQLSSYKI